MRAVSPTMPHPQKEEEKERKRVPSSLLTPSREQVPWSLEEPGKYPEAQRWGSDFSLESQRCLCHAD